MVWRETGDGSVEDDAGNVLFFSTDRFVRDICLGNCCFICGAKPSSKPFNDEHVIPEWVLRKFSLFDKTITLPNRTTIKYAKYKVPCCENCNSLMGRQIEERVSPIVNAGPDAVQKHIADGHALDFFVWLGLIFLKVHLKDREFRIDPDLRKSNEKIGDVYNWETLHHLHCIVRCFINGAELEPGVFGSLCAFPAKIESWSDQFDYGDVFAAQTMLLRLGDIALITTFNDASGALQGALPRLEGIEGPLSELQAREVMVDLAFMALSLKQRPKFFTECDVLNEKLVEKALVPKQLGLNELDFSLRAGLMRLAFGEILRQVQFAGKTTEQVEREIETGRLSFLFDDKGDFIKTTFVPLTRDTE